MRDQTSSKSTPQYTENACQQPDKVVHYDKEKTNRSLHQRLQRVRADKNVSVLITLPLTTGYSLKGVVWCVAE